MIRIRPVLLWDPENRTLIGANIVGQWRPSDRSVRRPARPLRRVRRGGQWKMIAKTVPTTMSATMMPRTTATLRPPAFGARTSWS